MEEIILYQYVLIPRQTADIDLIGLQNQVYRSWFAEWQKVFSSNSRDFKPSADDFLRQDMMAVILSGEKIVGFHFYSFFNLLRLEMSEHSYFDQIEKSSFENLRIKNLANVMSMEYLTVLPDFRKKEAFFPWGEILISLGLKVLNSSEGQVAFGTPRSDVKVNKMGEKLGFQTLQSAILKYDYKCEVMYYPRGNDSVHPEAIVENQISTLWKNRVDGRITIPTTLKKPA